MIRLAAEFQGYARDLHDDAVEFFVVSAAAGRADLVDVLRTQMTENRQLGRGNAQPASLGSDFDRLGLRLWQALEKVDPRTPTWRDDLEALNKARNAIAHADEGRLVALRGQGYPMTLSTARRWRSSLERLARTMDDVVSPN